MDSPHVELTGLDNSKSRGYSPLAQVVLSAYEHNELAYDSVADSGSLYFDLRVESVPPGANISYRRRGDDQYKTSSQPTDSTVDNLPRAIWVIRFQLSGWHEQEVEFDPFTEKEYVVNAKLKK